MTKLFKQPENWGKTVKAKALTEEAKTSQRARIEAKIAQLKAALEANTKK